MLGRRARSEYTKEMRKSSTVSAIAVGNALASIERKGFAVREMRTLSLQRYLDQVAQSTQAKTAPRRQETQ